MTPYLTKEASDLAAQIAALESKHGTTTTALELEVEALKAAHVKRHNELTDAWAELDAAREEVERLKTREADMAWKAAALAEDARDKEREACCEDIRTALTSGLLTPGQVQLAINTIRARGAR